MLRAEIEPPLPPFLYSADKLKSQLEKHQIARGIEVPTAGASTSVEPDRREEELKRMLESEKTRCVHV